MGLGPAEPLPGAGGRVPPPSCCPPALSQLTASPPRPRNSSFPTGTLAPVLALLLAKAGGRHLLPGPSPFFCRRRPCAPAGGPHLCAPLSRSRAPPPPGGGCCTRPLVCLASPGPPGAGPVGGAAPGGLPPGGRCPDRRSTPTALLWKGPHGLSYSHALMRGFRSGTHSEATEEPLLGNVSEPGMPSLHAPSPSPACPRKERAHSSGTPIFVAPAQETRPDCLARAARAAGTAGPREQGCKYICSLKAAAWGSGFQSASTRVLRRSPLRRGLSSVLR